MKKIKISVKNIVEFIYSGGDLTSEFKSNKRAIDGTEAHNYLQSKYTEEDLKEVFVETYYDYENYSFHITGRIDGVLKDNNNVIIEEIKSTKLDLELLDINSRPEHLAQAKMYAYLYLLQQDLKSIKVQLTYITLNDYEVKTFKKRFNKTQLHSFFINTIKKYKEWLDIFDRHQKNKLKSIEGLEFPYSEFREGQYQFMGACYTALIHQDILYSIAPTGIGKTIGCLFSGLKTIKSDREKLFYLTAKNAGKEVVVDTINLLKENGLDAKTVVINSKESMCLMDKVDCDPDVCKYAKGYFDRVNEALTDIFVHQDVYDMKLIKDYGEYHTICPHEFSLSISNYSDVIICDYNYAFDPLTHLIRYFEDDYYKPKLLIDEAHNMVDRSRSMYSSCISKSDLIKLKENTKQVMPRVEKQINNVLEYIEQLADELDVKKAKFHYQHELDVKLIKLIESVVNKCDQILSENKKFPNKDKVLDGYFILQEFIKISDYYNDSYRFVIESGVDNIIISLRCMDASMFVLDTIKKYVEGCVFFSATMEPLNYYRNLITMGEGKNIVIPSPFKQRHLGLFVDGSTSTRYRDRERSVDRIIDSIYAMLESKIGNYIVFFPSYQYLNLVLEEFDTESYECLVQSRNMSRREKISFLTSFKTVSSLSKVGFFVLGGSFSEGIDYVGEMLSGVLIVGVALPQFNKDNELLRNYFDESMLNGFDYVYTIPGFNKVVQAVGRVIRTKTDKGVAILFDDRFYHQKYVKLFPKNWRHYKVVKKDAFLIDYLNDFWNKNKE